MSALSALCEEYYQAEPGLANSQMQGELSIILWFCSLYQMSEFESNLLSLYAHVDELVSRYTEGLKSQQMLTRCGSALALGCLPKFMIRSKLKQVCLKNFYICFSHLTSQCLSISD